jgi:putative CocE/NonD family hydrolase
MTEPTDTSIASRSDARLQWGVKIPMRDGVQLSATLYTPRARGGRAPCIVTLTPYTAQMWHHFGVYFAGHGYPFLIVDCRGRGNSEGEFRPLIQEAEDGYDIVEWLARQPFCNGQVAMWGGSYAGYDQWATASQRPPHLATIVPAASVYPAVDFPMRNNVAFPYTMQWLTFVAGRALQEKLFFDAQAFWSERFRESFELGVPFKDLDTALGNPSAVFQEWTSHPRQDAYWDSHHPTPDERVGISIPILTITGLYDSDQPGALTHYREHVARVAPEIRKQHYLIIGPWDHAGTRVPRPAFGGLECSPASLIDLPELHVQWYAWTMQGGPKPPFLQKNVAYYVMGAERWRYADSLDAVTARSAPLHLQSDGESTDVLHSGALVAAPIDSAPDRYVYDPRNVELGEIESTVDPASLTDQRMLHAAVGRQLVYHSAPFAEDTEITGFFRFTAWLAIDQADTDFKVSVYDIDLNGGSVLMSSDWMRARYREGLREERLVRTTEPLRYEFARFTFISRRIGKGHRLRLVIGPINSIYSQKNYNSGGVVAEESMTDAQPVTVLLYHDDRYPSALHVPYGQSELDEEHACD